MTVLLLIIGALLCIGMGVLGTFMFIAWHMRNGIWG